MDSALRINTTVLPGGKIEVSDPQLPPGAAVEVIVLLPEPSRTGGRSIVDVLAEAPGQLLFKTAEEVDRYIRDERDAWDR